MAGWERFHQCPGCGLDLVTGEGVRSCAWGECPNLPQALDVWCPRCRMNLATGEGGTACEDPATCEEAVEARGHVANLLRWLAMQPRAG